MASLIDASLIDSGATYSVSSTSLQLGLELLTNYPKLHPHAVVHVISLFNTQEFEFRICPILHSIFGIVFLIIFDVGVCRFGFSSNYGPMATGE